MKDTKKTHNFNITKNESFEIENKVMKISKYTGMSLIMCR